MLAQSMTINPYKTNLGIFKPQNLTEIPSPQSLRSKLCSTLAILNIPKNKY